MNILYKILFFLISIPFRLKGGKLGKGSIISPGYDFLFANVRGIRIGKNCAIGRNAWLVVNNNNSILEIGDGTNIGRNVTISSLKSIRIGKKCLLSYNVSLLDHEHLFNNPKISPMDNCLTEGQEIVIKDDCFVGAHSFIMKGVHLGKHCVVGANSVVTKSFPDYSVIAGNPAKFLKSIKE
jgi:acetyltransferase-like isoleucine patch superfamily enzyme